MIGGLGASVWDSFERSSQTVIIGTFFIFQALSFRESSRASFQPFIYEISFYLHL